MRYFKKRISLSLAFLLLFSLSLSSLAMAEGEINTGTNSDVPSTGDSCVSYSSDRNLILAKHSDIVVNNDGTATATFQTTKDCVQVSFSAYEGAKDWFPKPGDTTIPYNLQTYFEGGQSFKYPKAGTYTLTIPIPACLPYQLDIYSGDLLKILGTGAHGDKIVAWKLKLDNTCKGKVIINKHINDSEGAAHAGITFELWKGDLLFKSGVTNSDGILEFNDLPLGTYTLKELTLDGFTTDLLASQQIVVTMDNVVKEVINTPKLKVESACSADPDKTRTWKVTNESDIEVPFTWEISDSTQTGNGVIPKNGSVSLSTNAEHGSETGTVPNTLEVYWGNDKELSLVNEGEICSTPTPSPSPSESPTPTPSTSPDVTPSTSPEVTPSASPEVTPSTSPVVTPTTPASTPVITTPTTPASTPSSTPTVTPSTSPSPEITPLIEIEEEEPPIGGVDEGEEGEPPIDPVIAVEEEQVPLETLPKTGDSSPIPYYLIGAFALSVGFINLRKQKQRK